MIRVLVISVVVFASSTAAAQSSSDEARARELFREGQSLVEAERYEDAYRRFDDAFRLSDRPLFLFNMAECARQAGQLDVARTTYARYLELDPNGAMVDTASQRLEELGPPSHGDPTPSASTPARVDPQPASAPPVVPTPERTAALSLTSDEVTADETDDSSIFEHWSFWAAVGGTVLVATTIAIVIAVAGGGDSVECGAGCVDFR